jgi:hypothetical protein
MSVGNFLKRLQFELVNEAVILNKSILVGDKTGAIFPRRRNLVGNPRQETRDLTSESAHQDKLYLKFPKPRVSTR